MNDIIYFEQLDRLQLIVKELRTVKKELEQEDVLIFNYTPTRYKLYLLQDEIKVKLHILQDICQTLNNHK